jgi:putative ABC transport system permease protein
MKSLPPKYFHRFFRWFCHPRLMDHIEGDLIEEYNERLNAVGKQKADRKFIIDVLMLFRPGIIRPMKPSTNPNALSIYRSYMKIGWRTLLKQKGYSAINVGGLAIGLTVAMLIGLWITDELSFNKYHKNYDNIGQVWGALVGPEGKIGGSYGLQYPVGTTLKTNYGHYFKHILMAYWVGDRTLSMTDKKLKAKGQFIEGGVINMLSLRMLQGNNQSLDKPSSIILSKSLSASLFGNEDPINKTLRIDNEMEVTVTGVYDDIPQNNQFGEVHFFAPWALIAAKTWVRNNEANWDNRPFCTYVQWNSNVSLDQVNAGIYDLYKKNVPADFYKTIERYKPFPQVIPMSTWHLYAEIENGKPAKGRITFVWLFGIIGTFVLILACINFVNLSTARSEKRAREVGVRKAIGSARQQLITQFLSESFLVVLIAFIISLALVTLSQPFFNELADKHIKLPFDQPLFWIISIGFISITGFLAGLYPAFYLSSFHPVKVLKGTLRLGGFAVLPRKFLVVLQFTTSVVLIIGTMIVFQQIQFAQNRPVGYDRSGLITIGLNDPAFEDKKELLHAELMNTGVVAATATSSSPVTSIWNITNGYEWVGKDPNLDAEFVNCKVSPDFGKTVGWEFVSGRDFSIDIESDLTNSIVVNEAAVKYMGLKNPVGQQFSDVDENGKLKWTRTIIGVVKDMVMGSPYEPAVHSIFYYDKDQLRQFHIRINPTSSANEALPKIEAVFKKLVPSALFDYQFVDEVYASKFSQEQRIGKLAGVFSILAIFISCLGLFGLASFVAEQRTKEIGIRKVMGASVVGLWKMLSRDFVVLVVISCVVAIPIGYYFMNNWLAKYQYRTEMPWWIFFATCLAALTITLLTVSYQSIKAALANPVTSLRSE